MILQALRSMITLRGRIYLIAGITLAAVVFILTLPPLPQDPAYHNFADQRTFFGVPNFFDVFSNAPFLLVGIMGLLFLTRRQVMTGGNSFVERKERWPYVVLFLGVTLSCFGSGYYHLAPDNQRLLWDRLPMTFGFMGFLAGIISDRISVKAGQRSLLPLVAIGVGSVFYWHFSELRGVGDMRIYLYLVQFYPLLAIPLLMLLFRAKYNRGADILVVIGIYAMAKIVEIIDKDIFELGKVVSGHTLKHIVAAFAVYWILRMLQRRTPISKT